MAALCTGNYGLSQNCTDNSKEYFFVKLTDSAYRAIEEYQRNHNKINTHATIQIHGNGGVISFPTPNGGNVGQQKFSFSIDDIEGSFECIQQTHNQLNVLGALPYKMRIHANDDVYETTRHRMAVAEENQKNKCTREIKPNQTDIGRKVKLKNSLNRAVNIPQKRDQLASSSSSSSSGQIHSPLSSSTTMPSGGTSLASSSGSSLQSNVTNSTSFSTNSLLGGNMSTHSPISSAVHGLVLPSSKSSSLSPKIPSFHQNNTSNNSGSQSLSNSLNSLSNHNYQQCNNNNLSKLNQNLSSATNSSSGLVGTTAASSLSSALSSAAGSGSSGLGSGLSGYYGSSNGGLRTATNSSTLGNSSSSNSRRVGMGISTSNSSSNQSNRNQRNGRVYSMPDITKKKIRERLIHLLALKPYKKPELYARLQNEGIREREKSLISNILKEISTMRDNTYNLKRQIWNDVNEDWPFYSEQELQMLKRRKPQNLTPPLSSDGGSSTSGQSPTSTHNGSPPPVVKRPSLDRDRFYEEPTAKKQRISHFKKDTNEINSSSTMPTKHQHESEDNAMSISYSVLGHDVARRISPREENMVNGHSSMTMSNQQTNSSSASNSHHHSTSSNNNSINNNNNSLNSSSSSNSNGNNTSNKSLNSSDGGNSIVIVQHPSIGYHNNSSSGSSNNNNINNGGNSNSNRCKNNHHSRSNSSNVLSGGDLRRKTASPLNVGGKVGSAHTINNSFASSSSPPIISGPGSRSSFGNSQVSLDTRKSHMAASRHDDDSDCRHAINIGNHGSSIGIHHQNTSPVTSTVENFDFSRFTPITTVEQRRLYKTEFENDYDEYRQLLHKIESVGRRFIDLADRLKRERNNDSRYRDIKQQILNEYERTNRDREHQMAKARFDYLHAKLAHIKSLVSDFDKTLSNGSENPSAIITTGNVDSPSNGNTYSNNGSSRVVSSNRVSSTSSPSRTQGTGFNSNLNISNGTSRSSSGNRGNSPLTTPNSKTSPITAAAASNGGTPQKPTSSSLSPIVSRQENY